MRRISRGDGQGKPDEPTLGADEVGTWKSYINFDHIAKRRCGPLLGDVDWHAFY